MKPLTRFSLAALAMSVSFLASAQTSGKDIKIDQSHAGSCAQARTVAEGLDADVVTMNTTTDVEFLAGRGVVAKKVASAEVNAYLNFLYSEEGQDVATKHGIRPRSEAVLKKYASTFKPLKLFTVGAYVGPLVEAQTVHFDHGGQFNKLYTLGK